MRSTPHERKTRSGLRLCRRSGQALVEIGDTGVGMSQEYVQTALFKPFQTTKEAGLGIGAYESYQYVRELGGSISVDSEPGRGTVMSIVLPLFESREASVLQMSSANERRQAATVAHRRRRPGAAKADQVVARPVRIRDCGRPGKRARAMPTTRPRRGDDGPGPAARSGFGVGRLQVARRVARNRSGHQGDRSDWAKRSGQRASRDRARCLRLLRQAVRPRSAGPDDRSGLPPRGASGREPSTTVPASA